VLLPLVAAVVAGGTSLVLVPRTYEAQASLLLTGAPQSSPLKALLGEGLGEVALPGFSFTGSSEVYADILESRRLAEQVTDDLGLQEFFRQPEREGAIQALRESVRFKVQSSGLLVLRATLCGTPQVRGLRDLWNRESSWARDQRVRELVAGILQSYLTHFEAYLEETAFDRAKSQRRYVEKRFREVERELAQLERDFERFRREQGFAALPEALSPHFQNLATLETQKLEAEVEREGLQAQINEKLRQLKAQAGRPLSLPSTNPTIEQWRKELSELKSQLALERERLGPEHATVLTLEAQIAAKEKQIEEEVARVLKAADERLGQEVADLEARRLSAQASMEALTRALAQGEKDLNRLPAALTDRARFQRKQEVLESLYKTLAVQLENARLTEEKEAVNFVVLDAPLPPVKKSAPAVVKNTVFAGLLGLCVGVFLALALERQRLWRETEPK